MDKTYSFPKSKIKILLVEKIHEAAEEFLAQEGFSVTRLPRAVEEEELLELLPEMHVLGVRSRTQVREKHIAAAKRLLAIGCFSVGTDQVDLPSASVQGIPVFNAPHSSTRSVAELTIANVIMLSRRAGDKNLKMHQNLWDKNVAGAREVRNKTLGIIGYGHIGQQVGLLADAIGMNVRFYDVVKKLPLGRAVAVESLAELLADSDVISLHVPGGPENTNMIGAKEFAQMKQGALLLNLSRGKVVDLEALYEALKKEQLGGTAVDVFPTEPTSATAEFECKLSELDNVILTPHIGGSTIEAQYNIGREVAATLTAFINTGSTQGAVNFPSVHLPEFPQSHRILNVHRNEPGALRAVNNIISELGANIDAQYLSTHGEVGYLIMDINKGVSDELKQRISELPASIKTRILY